MAKLLKKKSGFTLIELMIVVAILGILAALAVPAFITYVKRSKTGEAVMNLKNMFNTAASYYNREFANQSITNNAAVTKCTVGPDTMTPAQVGQDKQNYSAGSNAALMGFKIADKVYFGYSISGSSKSCGNSANDPSVYTFVANGDLDGDTSQSTFSLSIGADADNELYRGVGFFVAAELE